MKLNVTNPDGSVEELEVAADATGQDVKEKCSVVKRQNEKIRQASAAAKTKTVDEGSSVDPAPESFKYKLVCVELAKVVQDEGRLGDQGLKDADKLLLLKQRSAPIPKPEKTPNVPGVLEEAKAEDLQTPEEAAPALEAIREATKNVPTRNLEKGAWKERGPSSGMTSAIAQVRGRLAYRQGFVTLIEMAHKLLCSDSKAAAAVEEALENSRLAAKEKARIPMVDPEALQKLRDMGFPEIAARKALAANDMNVEPAMEWLLQHSTDEDYNSPLPLEAEPTSQDGDNNNSEEQTQSATTTTSSTTQNSSVPSGSETQTKQEGATNSTSGADSGAGASTASESSGASSARSEEKQFSPAEALQIFKEFRNRPRKPPSEAALHFLQRMGFSKEESLEALACNNNNPKTACDWLLGGKRPRFEELNKPLDESSHLHKQLVKNPVILMGLTKVRTLLALEHITHSPEALEFWLNDLDVGQVLNELNQIISMDFDFEDDPQIELALEALEAQEDED